jgi:hypothetical protein
VVEAVGHKLVTHQPVIEPFSAASGREGFGRDEISEAIFDPRTITSCVYNVPISRDPIMRSYIIEAASLAAD